MIMIMIMMIKGLRRKTSSSSSWSKGWVGRAGLRAEGYGARFALGWGPTHDCLLIFSMLIMMMTVVIRMMVVMMITGGGGGIGLKELIWKCIKDMTIDDDHAEQANCTIITVAKTEFCQKLTYLVTRVESKTCKSFSPLNVNCLKRVKVERNPF